MSPTLSAGAGLAWLRFDGQGTPPLLSTTEDAFSLLLYAEAALAYRLSGSLALRASIAPALAMTRVNIDFAGTRAATWGPLVASGSLALELTW